MKNESTKRKIQKKDTLGGRHGNVIECTSNAHISHINNQHLFYKKILVTITIHRSKSMGHRHNVHNNQIDWSRAA